MSAFRALRGWTRPPLPSRPPGLTPPGHWPRPPCAHISLPPLCKYRIPKKPVAATVAKMRPATASPAPQRVLHRGPARPRPVSRCSEQAPCRRDPCHPDDTDRIRGQHMVPQACGSDGCAVGYRCWRGRFKDRILPGPLRLGASRSALTLRTISGLTCHVSSRLHRRLLSILVMSTMRSLSYFKWGGCNSLVASANGRGSNVPSPVKV
jgi:hypothetical protein